MSKVILAIDPGSRKTGYAVIEQSGRKLHYISSGVLDVYQGKEFLDRLEAIPKIIRDLVMKYAPDEIAFESLIYVKSPTALMKLAQTRGAMIASFGQTHSGRISEYSPNLIKQTITGHGHAEKESVEKAVRMILGISHELKSHDESDALATAICHALNASPTKLKIDKAANEKKSLYKKGRGLAAQLSHLS